MKFKRKRFLLLFAVSGLFACQGDKTVPERDFMPDMFDSTAVKAQRGRETPERAHLIQQTPPEHTIPRGFKPYPYEASEGALAGKELKNPLENTKMNLERGQKVYNVYCIVCHGARGQGDGNVVPPFPRPPSLTSDKIAAWGDGQIYHTISKGQNIMPNYALQVPSTDRWAIALYIRTLRRAENPTESDIKDWESQTK